MGSPDSDGLSAGPLPLSDELRALLRLRRALSAELPGEELMATDHEVSLTFLEEVEASSGVVLPYDVIALATLRIPIVVRAVGLNVAHLAGPIRDCSGDFGPPRGWVAVASFGKDAMRSDVPLEQCGYDTLLAVAKTGSRSGDPHVRTLEGPGPSTMEKLSVLVRQRLAQRYATSERWQRALDVARRETDDDATCTARIVDDRPRPAASPVRVVHTKFGEGVVVRTLEDDKLEIAFDAAGTKTLQRRYVRELLTMRRDGAATLDSGTGRPAAVGRARHGIEASMQAAQRWHSYRRARMAVLTGDPSEGRAPAARASFGTSSHCSALSVPELDTDPAKEHSSRRPFVGRHRAGELRLPIVSERAPRSPSTSALRFPASEEEGYFGMRRIDKGSFEPTTREATAM